MILLLASPAVCCAQSIPELHATYKTARSKETRAAIIGKFHSLAGRSDLGTKEKTALRKVALELYKESGDENHIARMTAGNIFGVAGDKTCIEPLNELLADLDPRVRVTAIRISHTFHDASTVKALAELIAKHGSHGREYVKGNPIDALTTIGTKEAREALQEIFDNQPANKEQAAKALDALDARDRAKPKRK